MIMHLKLWNVETVKGISYAKGQALLCEGQGLQLHENHVMNGFASRS